MIPMYQVRLVISAFKPNGMFYIVTLSGFLSCGPSWVMRIFMQNMSIFSMERETTPNLICWWTKKTTTICWNFRVCVFQAKHSTSSIRNMQTMFMLNYWCYLCKYFEITSITKLEHGYLFDEDARKVDRDLIEWLVHI